MRPQVKFLTNELIEQIISEARDVLAKLGVEIQNDAVLSLLADHGARIDKSTRRAFLTANLIDQSIKSAPSSFKLYDSLGEEAVDLSGMNVNFTPGSAAIAILDHDAQVSRRSDTSDYIRYAKLMCQMNHIASQSTAIVSADVHEKISDRSQSASL
jgi:trimethylamine--corrinoid protein Co-methyltransferase